MSYMLSVDIFCMGLISCVLFVLYIILRFNLGVEAEKGLGRFRTMLSAYQATVLPGFITATCGTTTKCVRYLS